MSDLEQYYLDKEKQKQAAAANLAQENANMDKYIDVILQATPYVLRRFKEKPPKKYEWLTINGKRCLAWRFDQNTGSRDDRSTFSIYLTESGNIYTYINNSYVLIDTRNRIVQDDNLIRGYQVAAFQMALYACSSYEIAGEPMARYAGSMAPQRCVKEWDKKLGSSMAKRYCYIATAVYGSYEAPEVQVLRKFRDEVLQNSFFGRLFISTYYKFSPPVAERLKDAKRSNHIVKSLLDRWVERLRNTRGF